MRDAIGDLVNDKTYGSIPLHDKQQLHKDYGKLLPYVPVGGRLATILNALPGYTGAKCTFLVKRLMWDAPAFTMVGFVFIHPDGKRFITFREAMRLCSYPDDFMAHSPVEAVDAVLPVVARFLSSVAKKTIEKRKPLKKPSFQVVDWRPHGKQFHVCNMKGGRSIHDVSKIKTYPGAK